MDAQAQSASPGDANAVESDAREYDTYIEQALQAYDNGRFAEARSLFRRAHERVPTARTLRTIGMCSFNLGDYLDAAANLEAALGDPRRPLNPEQRAHVSELVTRAQSHVGRFRVRLTPAAALLWVDGRPPLRLSSGEVLLEPGRHELLAQATGYEPNRSTLQVEGGDRTALEIVLQAASGARAQAPTEAPSAPAGEQVGPSVGPTDNARSSSEDTDTQATLGFIALGVGGASLIAFGITTALASSKADTLEKNCPDRACRPAYYDDLDSYDRYKVLSTATLVGAIAFSATGALLLFTRPDESQARTAWVPVLGPGAVGVRGRL